MPGYLRHISTLFGLFLLISAQSGHAADGKFFPIQRTADTAFFPTHSLPSGQIVPSAEPKFMPIARTDRSSSLALRRTPASPQIGPSAGPPPVNIRSAPSMLGVSALLRERPGGPLFDTAIRSDHVTVANLPAPAMPSLLGPDEHVWPIDTSAKSRVTSRFGWRTDTFTGEPAFHGAVDIAAAAGSVVVATSQGVVHAVGEHPRLGRYVMLSYRDGSIATYGHLQNFIVATGQPVYRGQPIGHVGSTGRSTGPHVDFRIEIDGRRIDPLPLLRRPEKLAAR